MACHEIAALRIGMMKVLGIDDPAERQHELQELGGAAQAPGPLRALCEAADFHALRRAYEATLTGLDERVANTSPTDPKLPYLRTLLVLTKQVEQDLRREADSLTRLYRDLEEIHDLTHEIYPVGG